MVGYKYFVVKAKVLTKHTQTRVHQALEIWQNSHFLYNAKGKRSGQATSHYQITKNAA